MDGNFEVNKIEYENERYRRAKTLVWACFFLYVLMMGSKNVFTAELVTLQGVFGTTKAETSLAMTYYFITYAIGQMVLSALFGKINLRIFLFVTGTLSAIVTIALGLSSSIVLAYFLCGINGVFQAGIYSGCMGILARYLPLKLLPYANRIMSIGSAAWGVISYGCSALFVGYGLWNAPFIILGVLFLMSAVFFFYAAIRMKKFPIAVIEKNEPAPEKQQIEEKPFIDLKVKKQVVLFYVIILVITVLSEIMYYSVMNWIPDMLHDVFAMPEEYSILITIIVPIISAVFSIMAISCCEKVKNILNVSITFYLVSVFATIPLVFVYDFNLILSMILLALAVASRSGGGAVIGGVIAFKMRTRINSGSYTATRNASASVMAGVVPPIVGAFIDMFDGTSGYKWSYLIVSIAGLLCILTLFVFSAWYKKSNKKAQKTELAKD